MGALAFVTTLIIKSLKRRTFVFNGYCIVLTLKCLCREMIDIRDFTVPEPFGGTILL